MEKTGNKTNHWLFKMLAILALCVMLLVGMSLLHLDDRAIAAEKADQTITVSSCTINRGQEFDVDISIGNNQQGIMSLRLLVNFDPKAMTLDDVTAYDLVSSIDNKTIEPWAAGFDASGEDADKTYNSYGNKSFVLLWTVTRQKWYGEGKIATLRFLSKSTAEAGDYQISVTVDPNNTFLDVGQKRDLNITEGSGKIKILTGVYSVRLYDAKGKEYAYAESNLENVTIEKALEERQGLLPTKESTKRYSYEFRGWREIQSGDHCEYEPTYTATPVPYEITFMKGYLGEDAEEISYPTANNTPEHTSKKVVTIPYAGIINFDAEIPVRFSEYYNFLGWYKDAACTEPVDFAAMPDEDVTVYGYFKLNKDEPGVTTTWLEVSSVFDEEDEEDFVIATVSVTKNYGINSLLVAPEFDDTKLEFVGFRYDADSPFYQDFVPTFPEINAATKAGTVAPGVWQTLGEGESIDGKSFLFFNANSNTFTTGKLLTLKFKVKKEATSGGTIGLTIGNRDVTRFDVSGGVFYANAAVGAATVNVLRVEKPEAYSALESYIYDPDGSNAVYTFKKKGGDSYYDLTDHDNHATVGDYTAVVTLKTIDDTLVTWADGTKEALSFNYRITPFIVTKPVPTGDDYTYDGDPKYFAFTEASLEHSDYYTIEGDEETEVKTGGYTVTATLDDTTNFAWAGGGTEALEFPFVIKKLQVVKPTAYSAEEKTYTFNPGNNVPALYDNAGAVITYQFKTEDNDSKDYYTVTGNAEKNAGDYTVTVVLNDTDNTEWNDESTAPIAFDFHIGKYLIETPDVASKKYTGELQLASYVYPTNSPYEITVNEGGTELGEYPVVFTITEECFANYGWQESAIDSVTAYFSISESVNEWILQPFAYGKTYDGTPATVGASAKYGTVETYYRLQSETDADYTDEIPVDAGFYRVKFVVAGTESYEPISAVIPFEIAKVRLDKPVAYTEQEKTYTYTGEPIYYVFKQESNANIYDVTGKSRTDAGEYTVTVSIKNQYKKNYVWKEGEGESSEDQIYSFKIKKAQLTIPVSAARTYIENGAEQTYEFSTVEYLNRYSIYGNKHTVAGVYNVTARIENQNKNNYEWEDGTTSDKIYTFVIRRAVVEDDDQGFILGISSSEGFDPTSTFIITKESPIVKDLLDDIAAAKKRGVLGLLSDEQAAELVKDKCFVAFLTTDLVPELYEGSFTYVITLPEVKEGIVALRFIGDTIEVFRLTETGNTLTFESDAIDDIILLANHIFDREDTSPEFLISPATCEDAAVYYKSCSCGKVDEAYTFESGEPLGHNYDFKHVTWTWAADHLSATAKVVCLRDPDHVLIFEGEDVTITVVTNVPPAVDANGRIERKATFVYGGKNYHSAIDVEDVPAGHVYSKEPEWTRTEKNYSYLYKATFTCDCGESVVVKDATVTMSVTPEKKLLYTATVVFQGKTYQRTDLEDYPVVFFDYLDDTTEVSYFLLPGDTVIFPGETGHKRDGYLFVGWRDESGLKVTADLEYKIGFEQLHFTAEWKRLTDVKISVTDSDGTPIPGATVSLYENENREPGAGTEGKPMVTVHTSATGEVVFPNVPYGNYKLVVSYPYIDGTEIVRSSYLDVVEDPAHEGEGIRASIVLPKTKFNTVVEGVGSAEGLDGAISEAEKNKISDGAAGGTINEIVITQRRVGEVDDEIKAQINAEMAQNAEYAKGRLLEFFDITLWKTTTVRKANGEQYSTLENISVAESYQTNIFPISSALRQEIILVGGTVDNIYVYKRHEYAGNVIVIYNLPKMSEKEGENAQTECFFIKKVAGEEYIAIRQKEYSVLAFGVSPEPVLIMNKITSLTIDDRTYGDTTPFNPQAKALYGEERVVFSYSTEKDGEYTYEKPVNAGTYYLKAFIAARDGYGAAESIISFKINPKVVARPAADGTKFVYNGKPQTYTIAESAEYVVTGNVQTDAGKYAVKVALADAANTVWDSGLTVDLSFDFVIEKKKLTDIGSITFEDKRFWFNGKKHSIYIDGELPEGVEVVYVGNDESDLGRFTVTAIFVSTNPNYDVSEPMTAVMNIRLNWIPIVILIVIALLILVVAIVLVEKMLKKQKQNGGTPPPNGEGAEAPNEQEKAAEEGSNND